MKETTMHFASPLDPDAPCGPNLEYDPRLIALEEAFSGKPEQQMGNSVIPATPPNWKHIERDAASLMEETRDLRISVFWTVARLANAGLSGMLEGLEVIRRLCEEQWDGLWPVPDDGDVQERFSALMRLSPLPGGFGADMTVVLLLNDMELCSSPTLGSYRLSDIREAQEGGHEGMKVIRAALQDTAREWMDAFRQDLDAVQECLKAVKDCFDAHGYGTPDFRMVGDILKEMQLFFDTHPSSSAGEETDSGQEETTAAAHAEAPSLRSGGETAASPSGGSAVSSGLSGGIPSPSVSGGTISGRKDAVRIMEQLCRWFEENEPSSPVPYFLKRAIRAVGANLMEILADIAPHLQEQAKIVLNPEEGNTEKTPRTSIPQVNSPVPDTSGEYVNPFG